MAPYLFVLTRTLNLSFMLKRDTYPFFLKIFITYVSALNFFFKVNERNEENK